MKNSLAPCKEDFIHKIIIVSLFSLTSSWTLKCSVIVCSTIPADIMTLSLPCCFLLATDLSALDKIHPLTYLSDLSNVTRDSSVKITSEKSIFLYFLVEF